MSGRFYLLWIPALNKNRRARFNVVYADILKANLANMLSVLDLCVLVQFLQKRIGSLLQNGRANSFPGNVMLGEGRKVSSVTYLNKGKSLIAYMFTEQTTSLHGVIKSLL